LATYIIVINLLQVSFMIKKLLLKKNIEFMAKTKLMIIISAILIFLSILSFIVKGIPLGVDFSGGTVIEIKHKENIDVAKLRAILNENINSHISIQDLGDHSNLIIRISLQKGEDNNNNINNVAKKIIIENIGNDVEFRKIESFGGNISTEMMTSGIFALILAFVFILIYIWLRFSIHFSLGAIFALLHDIIITFGFMILMDIKLDFSTIAAILTIVGYSINDTVVIFDRIRVNLIRYNKLAVEKVLNISLNETLSRTILTAITTIVALLCLVLFGGDVIYNFSLVILFGVIIGTYSSIYIASPSIYNISEETKNNI